MVVCAICSFLIIAGQHGSILVQNDKFSDIVNYIVV